MNKERRSRTSRSSKDGRPQSKQLRLWSRWALDVGLILTAVLAIVYMVSTTGKAVSGYTAEDPIPDHRVRLQLVDATSPGDTVRVTRDDIESLSDMKLSLEIVERSSFDLRPVGKSFVISRQEDLAAARLVAERLGLDPDDVEYKPLVNNRNHVAVSLVLGSAGISPQETAESIQETKSAETNPNREN